MIRLITIVKVFLLLWLSTVAACSSIPLSKSLQPPSLTEKHVLDVLNKQLSQAYSIYKHRRRFRVASDQHQFLRARYIQALNKDSENGYIHYTQNQENGFDYVVVKPSRFGVPVPVYALNQFGFAYADGRRNIESITSIRGDVVHFRLRVIPGPILRSHGFTDASKIFNARAKLEYDPQKGVYEVIVCEQYSSVKQEWRKLGFHVENHGKKTVFFIDPDTELLYEFLSKYDRKSKSFEAMQPFQKYIKSIAEPL